MKTLTKINTLFLVLFMLFVQGQEKCSKYKNGKWLIDQLTAKKFQGRGYQGDGQAKAALFIAEKFEELNAQKVNSKSYLQYFEHPVTRVEKIKLKIHNTKLKPGVDYLIDASSPSIKSKAKYKLFEPYKNAETKYYAWYSADNFKENKIPEQVKIAFILVDKLTWKPSEETKDKVLIYLLKKHKNLLLNEISLDVNLKTSQEKNYKSQNVIASIPGEIQDSTVLIMAHYDHLGRMGKTIFPGANDNASGVAMLLNLMEQYRYKKPKYTTVFIAFGSEEIGLLGSRFFVENPIIDLSKVKFYFNFDLLGTGEKGIKVVNAKVFPRQYNLLKIENQKIKNPLEIKPRGEACNSDHCFFHQLGIPGFYIYTLGGAKNYHDIYDKSSELSLVAFPKIAELIPAFLRALK